MLQDQGGRGSGDKEDSLYKEDSFCKEDYFYEEDSVCKEEDHQKKEYQEGDASWEDSLF